MGYSASHFHQPPQYQSAQYGGALNHRRSSSSPHLISWGYRFTRFMPRHSMSSRDAPQQQRQKVLVCRPQSARGKSVDPAKDQWRRPSSSYTDSSVRQYRSETPEIVVLQERPTCNSRVQSAPQLPSSTRKSSPPNSTQSEPVHWSSVSRQSTPLRTKGRRRPLIFFVFGLTGAGKSTFIRKLLSRGGSLAHGPRQGHSLESCTREYEAFLYVTADGQEVIIFDTPGFDDSRFSSDAENLTGLARCLQRLHKQGQRIDGVIFMHPITDVRLRGSSLKMAGVIKRICGQKFSQRVALVTSMWDTVESKSTAMRRESMLQESPQFWGDFYQKTNGFQFENDFATADKVIQWLVKQSVLGRDGSPTLKMSQELQDNLLLPETEAGRFLLGELVQQRDQHFDAVVELRREILRAQQAGDRATANDFAEEERYEKSCAREAESARQLLHSRNNLVR